MKPCCASGIRRRVAVFLLQILLVSMSVYGVGKEAHRENPDGGRADRGRDDCGRARSGKSNTLTIVLSLNTS